MKTTENHLKATKHQENENHQKAVQCIIVTQGHVRTLPIKLRKKI